MIGKRLIRLGAVMLIFLIQIACESKPDLNKGLIDESPVELRFTRGGAPIEVIVRLSHKELELTDFLTVIIETRFEEGVHVTPPYLSEAVYNPLLLVENPHEETLWSEQKGTMINRWIYKFEPMLSGDFKLNPFAIHFRLEKEKNNNPEAWPVYQVNTEAISYKVNQTNISELDDIKDIKGLITPPYNYWIPGLTVLTLILLCSGIMLFVRHRQGKNPVMNNSKSVIDYYAEALNRLLKLEQRDFIDKAEFDRFHTELTSILRDYLEQHFGLRAKEQTTQEFIQEIVQTRKFTEKQRNELNRFLQLADLVKFATFQPGSQNSEDALNNVRTFIQTTGKQHEV